jgi:peptidoglycan/xylan/chitin deacetylase (PgdA/CDA1 family)
MLTFRIISFAFVVSIVIQSFLLYFYGFSWVFILIPITVYIFFLVYGSAVLRFNFYVNSIPSKQTKQKIIALTFDDGPDSKNTSKILDILAEYKLQACFFVIGEKVKNNPEILKRIDSENHIIGNHTFSHSNYFSFYSKKKMTAELAKTEMEIFKVIGRKTKLFRPPYGVTNPTIKKALTLFEYKIIGWNIRSFDTLNKSRAKLLKRLQIRIKPGSIVLFHDTCPNTYHYLKDFLDYILKANYEIIRLDQLLQVDAYE